VEHLDRSVAGQINLSRPRAFRARDEKDIATDEVKEGAQHAERKQGEQVGIGAVEERLVCQLRVPSKRGRAAARARLN
jgi:hypothetical protein